MGTLADSVCLTQPNAAEQVSGAHDGTVWTGFSTQHSFQGLVLRISCHGCSKKGMFVCHLLSLWWWKKIRLHLRAKKRIFFPHRSKGFIWCKQKADLGCCRASRLPGSNSRNIHFTLLSFKLNPHTCTRRPNGKWLLISQLFHRRDVYIHDSLKRIADKDVWWAYCNKIHLYFICKYNISGFLTTWGCLCTAYLEK